MSNESMNQHEGIQCDVCGQSNFRGSRYKCLMCPDFDMCSECFHRGLFAGSHQATHPMQCILSQTEIELYFRGEDLFICFQKLQSLTCPYCGLLGLTAKTLMKHLIYKHQTLDGVPSTVLCPICAARTWRNCNYTTDDLAAHLVVEHHLAGPASLVSRINENTVTSLRNPDAAPAPTPAIPRQFTSRANRASMDATFLELMSQLPDVRFDARGPPPTRGGNSSNVQALQQIQEQINQQQIANRPIRRGRLSYGTPIPPESLNPRENAHPSITTPSNGSRRASAGGRTRETALALQAALANETRRYCTNLNAQRTTTSNRAGSTETAGEPSTSAHCVEYRKIKCEHSAKKNDVGDDKFLLNRLLKSGLNETKLAKRDSRRADRSLFVQALLLSAFATNFEVQTATESDPLRVCFQASLLQIDERKLKRKKNSNTTKKPKTAITVFANSGKDSSA